MTNKLKYKNLLRGIPASPGIAIGNAYHLSGNEIHVEERKLNSQEVELEISRFKNAVALAKNELKELQQDVAAKLGEDAAKIFEVHQMFLEDRSLIDATISQIRNEKKNADHIFFQRMQHYQNALGKMGNDFFKSRSFDIKDVKRRIIRKIQGSSSTASNKLDTPHIIISRELTPSDTVSLDRRKILAFVTEFGGPTSHAAIMARSMGIPSVIGIEGITGLILHNERVIVDGIRGEVIIDPSSETLEYYQHRQNEYYDYEKRLSEIKELPSQTIDGKDIELSANMEFPDEIDSVISHGAKGVGLYRTEYLYLTRPKPPSEKQQYQEYQKAAKAMFPQPVIIRTVDLGGDKNPKCISIPAENNPFLGWRAIRICLSEVAMFKAQLRAILRAGESGNVKLLLPMISSVTELDRCIEILDEAKNELRVKNIPFNEKIEVGVTIEVPAAAAITDLIASRVDFLSIGTNDLIQYALAVDRGNEKIADLYQPFHPGILRLIRQIVMEGHRNNVWVGMCGEMAGDPLAILILIGLGLDELSVSPIFLPEIKQIIRSVRYTECVEIAERVMQMSTSQEIEQHIRNIMRNKFNSYSFGSPD